MEKIITKYSKIIFVLSVISWILYQYINIYTDISFFSYSQVINDSLIILPFAIIFSLPFVLLALIFRYTMIIGLTSINKNNIIYYLINLPFTVLIFSKHSNIIYYINQTDNIEIIKIIYLTLFMFLYLISIIFIFYSLLFSWHEILKKNKNYIKKISLIIIIVLILINILLINIFTAIIIIIILTIIFIIYKFKKSIILLELFCKNEKENLSLEKFIYIILFINLFFTFSAIKDGKNILLKNTCIKYEESIININYFNDKYIFLENKKRIIENNNIEFLFCE